MAAVGVAFSAAAQAPGDYRVALVIGNSRYFAAPLLNPANDARAMSEVLKSMGFTVVEARDASRAQMESAIAETRDALKGRHGIGMLYYAGHGLQLDWHNYMVPVDARITKASDLAEQTVDVQSVVDAFKAAGNRMNILVLDACRSNPFAATASAKGLAPMDAPPNTVLEYATAPGNEAEDGDANSGNGLYTQFLVREIREPGARIEDVFKRVRLQVRERSQGRQIPWESTSLEDDFSFAGGSKPLVQPAGRAREQAFEREKVDWDRIASSNDVQDFYRFLQRYPTGFLSEQAQFRLDRLQRPQVVSSLPADGVARLPSGSPRYVAGDRFTWEFTDGYTKVKKRASQTVAVADDNRVVFSNGDISDQMGGIIKHYNGSAEPAILQVPADVALGKKWRTSFVNTSLDGTVTRNYWDFKVVAFEELETPAGRFKAFKVEGSGESMIVGQPGLGVLKSTGWIDPVTMVQVRFDSLFRFNGRISEWRTVELAGMNLMPR